jgi:hypothetical protein
MSTAHDDLFDHLVIITRDQLQLVSHYFEQRHFTLTEPAKHNLGSINQLIILDSSYIELLGWEKNTTPSRKEIADLPIGLDALVFQTNHADATYQRLLKAGYPVNPVQDLSRPAKTNGLEQMARFKTVRFSRQPIAGLRIYFCEHLTPEAVWNPLYMTHTNRAQSIHAIEINCPTSHPPEAVVKVFEDLLGLDAVHHTENDICYLPLRNTMLRFKLSTHSTLPQINLVDIQAKNDLISIHQNEIKLLTGVS